ncbi:hypothetical protein A0H81_13167 [Grifola frondosa]|uniref:Uncharacterized protein n=1 Tax=Grifola frondosa TaxID=5627 RepID=A0A1C7LQ80_GRIFR|nr:hypothetical protein A0H81_13167 [Grifola frondosa]
MRASRLITRLLISRSCTSKATTGDTNNRDPEGIENIFHSTCHASRYQCREYGDEYLSSPKQVLVGQRM